MKTLFPLLLFSGALMASAPDPALEPPAVIHSPGAQYADDARVFQGIPGIERAPNGRLWATWYAGRVDEPGEGPGNFVVLTTSGDDGQSWSAPKLAIDPPGAVRAYDPALWQSPDGRLWLFWAQSYQWWDGRAGVWCIVTSDPASENPHWSQPRRIADGILMNKPTVTANGEWLLPVSIWPVEPRASIPAAFRHDPGTKSGANVWVSRDRGKSFTFRGQATIADRRHDEHMLVERRDGSLWMLIRAGKGIGESESRDGGRTWSPGRPSTVPNVTSRFFIRRLRSGRLLAVTHRPPGGVSRSHLMAYLSDDDGRTWTGGLMLDERDGVSYPDGIEAPDGTLYVIYDYQRTGAKQILMSVFDEEDVRSGKWNSPRARKRVLVNQATGLRLSAIPLLTHTDVFASGKEGYSGYRIPALAATPAGTLVAVVEGRRDNKGDPGNGDINLVMKRSTDQGRSWSKLTVLDDPGEKWSASNPSAVVDRSNGRIWVAFNRLKPGRGSENSRPGTDDAQAWLRYSDDQGVTWSEARDITRQARNYDYWGSVFFGPGGAIQTKSGRLVFPAAMCDGTCEVMAGAPNGWTGSLRTMRPFVVYSDDHGATWQRSELVKAMGDENQVVELADGSLMMDLRQGNGDRRFLSISRDQGTTWAWPTPGQSLITVATAIERFTTRDSDRNRLLWTGPAGPGRRHLVVRVSYDEGQTWPNEKTLYGGIASYSDIAILPDATVGVLWERGITERTQFITFTRFSRGFVEPPGTLIPEVK